MNRSVFKKHFGQAADETAQSSSLCTSEPYRQGNPKQSSPRSPGQSASLPFHTHCSSFWNLETIQLCVTKAGRWSLQRGTQSEGRHGVLQSSLYKADGAHQGKNPHGLPLPASWSRLVALAPDDKRVDHGRLQQPPANVSPPLYRWLSNRVV